jgi:CzcA family heavy metal efflux pump
MKEHFFTKFRNPLLAVIFFSLIGGYFIITSIKTELLPNVVFPKIKILADNGDQPVDKMMITVTRPLEEAIKQTPYLQKLFSTTSRGETEISIYLSWDADVDVSEQQVQARISQIKDELPPGVEIQVEKMSMYSVTTVLGYKLSSTKRTPIDLNWIAKYTVKPFLSQVDGVSRVETTGGKDKEYWVTLNTTKMSSLGITTAMVRDAIQKNDFIESNGYSADYNRMYLSITDASIYNIPELENIIVNSDSSGYVHLKDIADVQVHEQLAFTRVSADGKRALLVEVLQQSNANLIEFTKRMEEKIKELQKILPADVHITNYYEQSGFVSEAVSSVQEALVIGLVLALIVVVLFLLSFKASFTVLITIPVSLSLTVLVMYLTGITFNIMSLGAIAAALGLIIDDAIVVVEQIHGIRETEPDLTSAMAAQKAISKLLPYMIGSSLSTIVIFIPFAFLLSGVSGAFFKVLSSTMMIALICSFFVSWILLPVIYCSFKETNKSTMTGHKVTWRKWVYFFVTYPWTTLILIAIMVAGFLYVTPKLKTGFLPDMDEGTIVLNYFTPPGTSFEKTDSIMMNAERAIMTVPEVKTYIRRTGTQSGFAETEPNCGDFLIQLKSERKKTTEEVIDDIRDKIDATGQPLHTEFMQRIGDILGDLMGESEPIQIKLYGDDPDRLQSIATVIADSIALVPGTADVFSGVTIAGPYVNIRPDLTKLRQFNISPDDFQFQLATQLNGSVAGSVFEKQQLTNIRLMQSRSGYFQSVDELRKSSIFLPDGRLQPIAHLASITPTEGVAEVTRENLEPIVLVTTSLNNTDLGTLIKGIKKVMDKVTLPQGYHYSFGGAYEEQQKSFHELLIVLIISCLLVFSIMLFLFKDFKAAFVVVGIAVLAVTGSLIALFITGIPLNLGSYTGLIMIVGIVGENAIFTFQQFAEIKEREGVKDALVFAISIRLRPNIMTAMCAIIALLPLAFGIGTGASLHRPLAVAVIGGFATGVPLLLIVFPALLSMVYGEKRKKITPPPPAEEIIVKE